MKFENWIRHKKSPGTIQFEQQWKSKYCDWAKYIIDVDLIDDETEKDQIEEWIRKNLTGQSSVYFYEIYFELEEDSILFALRWL